MPKNSKIVIIDYGSGNLRSVFNAISSIKTKDQEVIISSNVDDLKSASHIILPGVGSYGDCMRGILAIDGMVEQIKKQIKNKKPFLGICVGMQLLSNIGYENEDTKGLGLISGEVAKLNNDSGNLKIPHIGWNDLEIIKDHEILQNIKNKDHFYFVHSYHFLLKDENCSLAKVDYGRNKINAIIAKDNIVATQFHPEKSADAGLQLLKNFINIS